MARRLSLPKIPVNRNVALCYIRQSVTRDSSDATSPERQREHCRAECARRGWTPEFYEDVTGHKSGRKEQNRPGWMTLKSRMQDPDVVALVANDLSRFHRRGWKIGELLDMVSRFDLQLVLADPSRQTLFDLDTAMGRTIALIAAQFDEWYSEEISQRARSSVLFRKSQGKTVGLPPFGTIRDKQTGYLIPSPEGAWRLLDGSFLPGEDPQQPPQPGAIWRSYYEATRQALSLYAENRMGIDAIARELHQQGYLFRDRQGHPSPFEGDDVRRIVANWPEYGGYISRQRARERHPYEQIVDDIVLLADRAVFDVDLLYSVGRVRRERTTRPRDRGHAQSDHPYPLGGITFCAHCENLAREQNNPRLRSRLGGKSQRRYRHRAGVQCGCTRKSVLREALEGDFHRLVQALVVRPDYEALLSQLALRTSLNTAPSEDLEARKQIEIASARKRIEHAVELYLDNRISRERLDAIVYDAEHSIQAWEARTTEQQRIAMELALCVQTVEQIARLWESSDDEDRQGMAQRLFDYLVYDLDLEQIVDFRLKPWAERFLQLRVALFDLEEAFQAEGTNVTPTGLRGARQSILILFVWPSRLSSMSPSATPTILCLCNSAYIRKSAIA